MLTRIEVHNVGIIEHLELDLTGPLAVFGFNRSGKTTVLDAVRYVLFGYCSRTDAAGRAVQALVREGAEYAEIAVTFRGAKINARIWPGKHSPQTEWWVSDADGAIMECYPNRASLWHAIEATGGPCMRDAVICADPVACLSSKELAAALAALGVKEIDLEIACQSATLTSEQTVEMLQWFHGWAAAHGITGETMDALQAAGAAAFAQRTGVNRDRRIAQDILASTPAVYLPKGVTSENATARLAMLREEINALDRKNVDLEAELCRGPDELMEWLKGCGACDRCVALAEAALPKLREGYEIEAEMIGVKRQRDALQAMVDQIEAWLAREGIRANVDALTNDAARLSWAVAMFRDGAAFIQAAREPLQEFRERANTALAPYGMEISFSVDGKTITPYISTEGRAAVPLTNGSGGERIVAAWAIAREFSRNVAPILLDDADGLDGNWLDRFLAELQEHRGPAIIARAWPYIEPCNTAELNEHWAPLAFAWMQEGELFI